MYLLAVTAQEKYPEINARIMKEGHFIKFLEVLPEQTKIDILIELNMEETEKLHVKLLTKKQLKTMSRMTIHCDLHFDKGSSATDTEIDLLQNSCSELLMEVSAEKIYQELVPFGTAYQTLQGNLYLEKDHARGILHAPALPLATKDLELIGSPFPLDGAMHAACVHGQHLVDFVPFPVGFDKRTVHKPTIPGESYATCVHIKSLAADELIYDLQITDQTGKVRETVWGLRMRDVSGGRIKPPSWIKACQRGK